MNKRTHIWLFKFTAYSYCQGSRDSYEESKLLIFTLPCEKQEAKSHLINYLNAYKIEFESSTIESCNIFITNS